MVWLTYWFTVLSLYLNIERMIYTLTFRTLSIVGETLLKFHKVAWSGSHVIYWHRAWISSLSWKLDIILNLNIDHSLYISHISAVWSRNQINKVLSSLNAKWQQKLTVKWIETSETLREFSDLNIMLSLHNSSGDLNS